ncbi:MAG: peptide ABC transporter substrate-binding protein [Oscillochloris sp.]|nr:peptide ABC transporter substrate-binding protein [Oscillochloris sp.]
MNLLLLRRNFPAALAAALLVLAACSTVADPPPPSAPPASDPSAESVAVSEPTDPPPTAAEPTTTPLPRGGNLTIRLAADLPDLKPWQPRSRGEEQLTSLLYSGLTRLDAQLRPVPDLAESWQASADGRTITVTLHNDLRWHDDDPLDADDVLFTLDQLRTLPPTSTALLADLRYIASATAPTSDTVVLNLTGRYAPLLSLLAVPILPSHILSGRDLANVDFWDVPIGSGPFRLSERQVGQSIVLDRFDHFHRGPALLDRVAFVLAPDPAVALNALGDERLLLAELPWSLSEMIPVVAPNTQTATYPENGYYFLGFNLREGRPFADLRVRQALTRALDLPRLVEAATDGQGIPLGAGALPGSWADLTPPNTQPADLEAARTLLDEAGWTLPPDGTIRTRGDAMLTASLYVRGDDERRVLAARRIAETAASIGMQIEVIPGDFDTVILARYAPPYDFDLLLGSWSNGAGDPDYADVIYYDPDDFALFHSSQLNQSDDTERATRNFIAFNDSAYDNQAQAARQLYAIEERIAAITQTQARLSEQLPYLFLWADRIPVALNERVTTLDGPVDLGSPLYFWNIERWYLR